MKKRVNGFISIFLALIALPVYSFAILTIDIARIASAKNHIILANENANESVLTNYNKDLYEKFNILAIDKESNLDEYIEANLKSNLDYNESKFYKSKLIDSSIEYKDEDHLYNFENLEKQIVDYMKLKSSYDFASGILNLIDLTQESKSYTNVFDKKYDFEKSYSDVNVSFQKINDEFIKYSESFDLVNGEYFNLNNKLSSMSDYNDQIQDIRNIVLKSIDISELEEEDINARANSILNNQMKLDLARIDSYVKENNKLEANKLIAKNNENISFLNAYKKGWSIEEDFEIEISGESKSYNLKQVLNGIVSYINAEANTLSNKLRESYDTFYTNLKELKNDTILLELNISNIIHDLENMLDKTKKMEESRLVWGQAINDIKNSEIKNNFNAEYKTIENKFTQENIENLLNKMKTIKDVGEKMRSSLDHFQPDLESPYLANFENIISAKISYDGIQKFPSLGNYKIYKYIIENNSRENSDNKESALDNMKNINNLIKEKPAESNSLGYINDFISDIDDSFQTEITSIEDLSVNSNVDSYKKIMNTSNEIIAEDSAGIYENLLIALYINEQFDNKDDLANSFKGQVEYIIFGNDNLDANITSAKNSILAIRFLLNSIYAYTNSDLSREAGLIATGIAGWTGFGVPLVKSAVLGGMSFGESMIDLSNIDKNKSVAAYKNKATWTVSVSSIPSILANGIENVSHSAIDNLFDIINEAKDKGIDEVKNQTNIYVDQTIDGVSQSIISEIITPVQNAYINSLNKSKENLKTDLEAVLQYIESQIDDENYIIQNIKTKVFGQVRDFAFANIDAIDEINFEEKFDQLSASLESSIKAEVESLSSSFKNELFEMIDEQKVSLKRDVSDLIDNYMGQITSGDISNSRGSKSGLNYEYEDYLVLLSLFGLSSSRKTEIMSRMLMLMEHEIKSVDPDFNIRNMVSGYKIISSIETNTLLIKKYILQEPIESSIIGGY